MVVEMLRAIRDEIVDSNYIWVQILEEKLEESSIDIKKAGKDEDLLYVGQKVLDLPLTNLNNDLKKIGKKIMKLKMFRSEKSVDRLKKISKKILINIQILRKTLIICLKTKRRLISI